MSFYIASKKYGERLGGLMHKTYKTRSSAQAALTHRRLDRPLIHWEVCSHEEYERDFVKKRFVKNLMNPTGPDVEIRTDTPACCDPSSEAYWSN